ncbi:MAG: DAK2 domain-containing protein [Anaerolineae bacterium]|nr:DAK2 domain-containing protein [Anaerolineae bacterium]
MTPSDLSRIDPEVPVIQCNGLGMKRLWEAGLAWLEANYETVNALNVFPVPDGDTGTNMLLTLRSAYKEVANSQETHAGHLSRAVYNGALMGARGNSGVILSQLIRGFARGVQDDAEVDVSSFTKGLHEAVHTAYQAVQTPVEGTILTVAREGSAEAARVSEETADLRYLITRLVEECHRSVKRTPDLLPVLKEAGVVDSGGTGLLYIFEGMQRMLNGQSLELSAESMAVRSLQSALTPQDELGYGYDVQFLIKGANLDVNQIRSDIEAMGESGVIVGDENLVKVHIHVHNPAVPIHYGVERGVLLDVVVENMQEQYEGFVDERGAPGTSFAPADDPDVAPPTITEDMAAVITVAPGKGFTNIFYSLGAAQVIAGGQTMNPSTRDFIDAIEALPTSRVIILPNNSNIFMAANQAASAANGKDVRVIPTRTIPQGISALLVLDPYGEMDEVTASMQDMIQSVETGEITTSVRNTTFNGLSVREGQIIGLHNDVMCVAGEELKETLLDLLEKMGADSRELITLYRGMDVSRAEADAMVKSVQEAYPEHEIELRYGGQPHYFYVIGVE